MLTRFVRIQLIIFTVASIVGVITMLFTYIQVPALLGAGGINVKLELPGSGGLYRFSNVTYRGVQVGKVTSVVFTAAGAEATLTLDSSQRIPANLQAQVHSMSAIGEQYVDLLPHDDSAPYLRDGSVIAAANTTVPQEVGPMLDQVSALVNSIPKDNLHALLDETFKGFNGAGEDFGSFVDSSAILAHDLSSVGDQAKALVDDTAPLLDSQAKSTDAIQTWAHSLAGITDRVVDDDPQLRTVLRTGPGFAQEVSRLLDQVKPTLPILLANLTTVGQIAVTYHPSLEQILVLLPPVLAGQQSAGGMNNPTGMPVGEFALTLGDPPACTVGFLPPSSWRSPADTSVIDTPDNIYCKLPQDSPIAVRGARNYPCMGHPGKRAPTVEICNSDEPYEPLAERQHVLGPYPIDPNLIAQGVPPDDRIHVDSNIYGPLQGTPLPAGSPHSAAASDVPDAPAGNADSGQPSAPVGAQPLPPTTVPAPVAGPAPSGDSAPTAAPSSFNAHDSGRPSVVFATYDPRTGQYAGSDARLYTQSDLVAPSAQKSWKDLLPS